MFWSEFLRDLGVWAGVVCILLVALLVLGLVQGW